MVDEAFRNRFFEDLETFHQCGIALYQMKKTRMFKFLYYFLENNID